MELETDMPSRAEDMQGVFVWSISATASHEQGLEAGGVVAQTNPVVKEFYACLVSGRPFVDSAWERFQKTHPSAVRTCCS